MDSCDVLIVGGGPGRLLVRLATRGSGLDVVILDKQVFPRHKVCGGWITPAVLAELDIDPAEYGRDRVLQPITAFRTGSIGGPALETEYGEPVSYGIRRCEFDDYLLRRSGRTLLSGAPLKTLERAGDRWIANGSLSARIDCRRGRPLLPRGAAYLRRSRTGERRRRARSRI